jgi:hypothetical protein
LETFWMATDDGEKLPGRPAGKVKLLSLTDIDRRCKAAQHAEEMRSAIAADLGGEEELSTLERALVEHAAMNAAMLRHLHVSWLKGEPAPIGEVVSLQNVFNRVAQQLGTKRRPKDVLSIDSYLKKGDHD